MFHPIAGLSRLLSHLRWLFMPLGLFALVAVGVHAGASVAHDAAIVALDRLDLYGWLSLDRREVVARWLAVALELFTVLVLAWPSLFYRERRAEEKARETSRQQRLAELVAQKLAEKRAEKSSPPRPAPVVGGFLSLVRCALADPTLLRVLLPLATAGAVVAGACRIAIEMQADSFGLFSRVLDAKTAGDVGRAIALFVVGAVLVTLGFRAVFQALWWAHRRSEDDRAAGRRAVGRRTRGWLRMAVAVPLAAAAAFYGAPLLSFFR